jgi:hypothetical protein
MLACFGDCANNSVSNADPSGECGVGRYGDPDYDLGGQAPTMRYQSEGGSPFDLAGLIEDFISLFGGGGSQPIIIPRKLRHRPHIIQDSILGRFGRRDYEINTKPRPAYLLEPALRQLQDRPGMSLL